MERSLLIGIDGGATHSTAVAAWPDGTVAAVAYGEGLNFNNVGVETVRLRMENIVRELMDKAGAPVKCVCVGSAALDAPADEVTTQKFTGLMNASQLDLQSDAYIALMSLTRGRPGMIAICGTGSMLLLADSVGRQHVSGGWGYLMEDAGSGYAIAREGLLAAIAEYEGTGASTALTAAALSHFGLTDLRKLIDVIYSPEHTPDKLAAFARHVLTNADAGDTVARNIITCSMAKLARQAAELFKKAPGTSLIGLYGGIFAHSDIAREAFEDALTSHYPGAQICAPEYPPEIGAVLHLMAKYGLLTDESYKNLGSSYERIRK